ncbi:MAG: BON domain-containing protein [Acidobacteriia bacterium]|nr:BON domain-containing protein [Terriglobia bacterium]
MRTTAAAILVGALACAGQTRPAPAPHPPATAAAHQRAAAPKSAARPARSDAAIEADIRARFAKSKINADKFQVHVQGGVATIEGRTNVIQHKGVATRMAKTGGALAVNNHVQTSEAARQKAADNLEKGRRRAQIKRGDARSDAAQPRQAR